MDFNILKEVRKMLELMDKSKTVKRFLWAILICTFLYGVILALPDVIKAFIEYQKIKG
ncbi:Uncharacterised protein [Phocoenobacter uteri]|uniref:Uncharacterized protein n=1 Tax=Phocoenobacter uteri TaxID=146806 RepID=A0A379C9M2_9PAST|nr:hypothetical protein [Phocoenobacter uteri]SUB58961.1 Uncharacterised protein [Phocoenobacter uteri]